MTKIILLLVSIYALETAAKVDCDFYLNKELASRKIGSSLDKIDTSAYDIKILTDKKSQIYQQLGYDTLFAYPDGSDPFGENGYKETQLSRQIMITPKNSKTSTFQEIRVFVQSIDQKELIAGYSIVGDKNHDLEKNRVFLQETKTCKIRLAHNYYNENAISKKTGVSRGWVKVNRKVCENLQLKLAKINNASKDNQALIFRSVVPEPAVTEDDFIAIKDALDLCEYVKPGILQSTQQQGTLTKKADGAR